MTATNSIQLDSGLGTTVDYDDYMVSIYQGPGRFNVRRITSYTKGSQTAGFSIFSDYGDGNKATTDSRYILGALCPDFEINDITIIYRPKRVK